MKEGFQPHFNHSVGQYVSSKQQFLDALAKGGDKAGSTYTMVEHGDLPRTEHGMEETRKFNHDNKVTNG